MAKQVPRTPTDADNSSGLTNFGSVATCNDWHTSDADSMSAWDIHVPTSDAGYTPAGAWPHGPHSVSFLCSWGGPYKELERIFVVFGLDGQDAKALDVLFEQWINKCIHASISLNNDLTSLEVAHV